MTIPVYLVDDDAALSEALSELISTRGYAVTAFSSGQQLIDALPGLAPGILLLDQFMPGLTGLEVQEHVASASPQHRIILLSGRASVPMTVRAIQGGAADVLEKPVAPKALFEALHKAADALREEAEAAAGRQAQLDRIALLTARERSVLAGVVRGLTNKEVARELGISYRTVEFYRAMLMRKLAVDTLPDLVRVAQVAELETASAPPPNT